MRGFTILLVVMSHVSGFILMQGGTSCYSMSNVFGLFMMPLFFFISGFVMYKARKRWNLPETCLFLKKKITALVLSPMLFMLVMGKVSDSDFVTAMCTVGKGGYWFTFTLFEYFILYIFFHRLVGGVTKSSRVEDLLLLLIGLGVYAFVIGLSGHFNLEYGLLGFWGIQKLLYFMYFIIGTRIRKHFGWFEMLLDKKYSTALLLGLFVTLCLFPEWKSLLGGFYTQTAAIAGVLLVLAIFRHYQYALRKDFRLGCLLQFVGQRTLDIYLIHYFFIFSNLQIIFPNFGTLNTPFAELMLSFVVSVVIVACSLLVSLVLRVNPFVAHMLFGQKYNR